MALSDRMRELVTRCRAGDREAFGALVERTRSWALRYARSLLAGDPRAEDAVQEAYLLAWERIDSLRHDAAFLAWLRCLIRTQAGRITRRRAILPLDRNETADAGADPPQRTAQAQLRAMVARALAQLPARNREAVDLFYFKERSIAEVSRHLGIPGGTVKRRLYDARQRLRRLLSAEDYRSIL